MRGRNASYMLTGLLLAVCFITPNHGECTDTTEYKVKAAFIYNFAKFVEWPDKAFADTDTPITVGIFRDDAIADAFEQAIKGKAVNGRKLVAKRFSKIAHIQGCHILYVSETMKAHLSDILNSLKDSSVLTVGETDGFARRGGMIGLVMDDNKIGFEVNIGAAKRAGVKISSKLLKLAKAVRD